MFCDADWAGDRDDRRSTSGGVVLLNGDAVIWHAKKQSVVAHSTAEAEYIAMSYAVQEAKWLANLLSEIGARVHLPVDLYSDNQAAIAVSSGDRVSHSRTRHIDLRHHYVRELVESGWLRVAWVSTSEQMADVCTKALPKHTFEGLIARVMQQQESNKQEERKNE